MKAIRIALLFTVMHLNAYAENALPKWFLQTFNALKLEQQYKIIQPCKPAFLEADFNGDHQNDVVVQIIDLKTKKRGLLIINGGQNNYFVFGGGKEFTGEGFSDTNWLDGWRVFKNKQAYEPILGADGGMSGSKKIILKHPAISIFSIEENDEISGELIYWKGNKYISIHQGE